MGHEFAEGKLGHHRLVTAPAHVRTAEEDTDEGVRGPCLVTITTAAPLPSHNIVEYILVQPAPNYLG